MDKWEDYPIKVLDIAPLIMVTLPMVSYFSSTCGCFLRVERSFSRMISLVFSLSSLWWPLGRMALCRVNGGASRILGSKDLRVQEKGGRTDPRMGPVDWLGPTGLGPCRLGSVTPSLPWVLMYLGTLPPPLAPFWRCHHRVQDGGSPCMKSGLLRFNPRGCFFVILRSLPPLRVISSSS
jgi:hypothetical protein